jgi:hypothetical protein
MFANIYIIIIKLQLNNLKIKINLPTFKNGKQNQKKRKGKSIIGTKGEWERKGGA